MNFRKVKMSETVCSSIVHRNMITGASLISSPVPDSNRVHCREFRYPAKFQNNLLETDWEINKVVRVFHFLDYITATTGEADLNAVDCSVAIGLTYNQFRNAFDLLREHGYFTSRKNGRLGGIVQRTGHAPLFLFPDEWSRVLLLSALPTEAFLFIRTAAAKTLHESGSYLGVDVPAGCCLHEWIATDMGWYHLFEAFGWIQSGSCFGGFSIPSFGMWSGVTCER